jgi:hypothetical protein
MMKRRQPPPLPVQLAVQLGLPEPALLRLLDLLEAQHVLRQPAVSDRLRLGVHHPLPLELVPGLLQTAVLLLELHGLPADAGHGFGRTGRLQPPLLFDQAGRGLLVVEG